MLRAVLALVLGISLVPLLAPPTASAAGTPTHALSVSGTGVAMYPAFTPSIERFAVTTQANTGGSLTITATTSDPGGTVLVDGRPATGAVTTVSGLAEGDEVSVIFVDQGGTERHSLVYLPAGFPTLTETVPAAPGTMPGDVLVNLSRYSTDGSPNFEAALDHRGVPAYVASFAAADSSADLKPLGSTGHYTVERTTAGHTAVDELDSAFRPVHSYETVAPATSTDTHDSIVRPDGSRIMLAYQPNAVTGLTDAVIQEIDAAGHEVYTWNSSEHLTPADETTSASGDPDYAHINSISVMADGDILASFRHFSSVYKIAWSDRGNVHRGDIVWRLGGRHSSFDFVDDPDGGPCAQHSATQLPNGHILLFDNGSVAVAPAPTRCIDQSDPTGPTTTRRQTRIAEYALDTAQHTATLVWSYQKPDWFSFFAGSARRLTNGNTLIGWAAETRAIASEVDPSGTLLWELRNDAGYLSYRVWKAPVPDTVRPRVSVDRPVANERYAYGQAVTPDFSCTDRGGSSLQTCSGSRAPLDTRSPGRHTYAVAATDGAGNTTRVTRSYTVAAAPFSRPDALVHRAAGRAWVGNGVFGSYRSEHVVAKVAKRWHKAHAVVRVQAEGNRSDTYRLTGASSTRAFSVRYTVGGVDVTSAFTSGGWRRTLQPGQSVDVVVTVTRLPAARRRAVVAAVVRAYSGLDWRRSDLAGLTVRR